MKESTVQQKSFQFSLKIIALYKKLLSENEYIVTKELSEIHELIRLLTAIVKTSQQNLTKN